MRKKKLLKVKIGVAVLTILLVGSSIYFAYSKQLDKMEQQYSVTAEQAQQKIAANTRTVYVAKEDIKMGSALKEDMVELRTDFLSEMPQEYFITSADFGKITTIPIKAGMEITTSTISKKLSSDLKERECSFIWLNTNLVENDYVDIRILFPNGEDYVVLAKKSLKNLNLSANNVFLWLSESNINTLSAALVDANLRGAKLYTTKYLKPEVQQASIETYEPSATVIDLISRNPNIVQESQRALSKQARAAMESRLEAFDKANPGFVLDEKVSGNASVVGTPDTGSTDSTTEAKTEASIDDGSALNPDGTLNGANGGYSEDGDIEYVE